MKHWFTLSVFFSVWDEDLRGQPLNRKQHGHLREGKLRLKTAITHVSSTSAHPLPQTRADVRPVKCCCTVKNLALPPYQPYSGPSAKDEVECDLCACGQPLDQLMERELDRHGDDIDAFDELGDVVRGLEGQDERKGRERAPIAKS